MMEPYPKYEPEFESFIEFVCPVCKAPEKNTIPVPASIWDDFHDTSPVAEQESQYICGNCLHTHRLLVRNLNQRITVKFIDQPSTEVKATKAFWSEEFEATGIKPWKAPEEATYNVFETTRRDVIEVIETPNAEFFESTLSRMSFIQLFAALEAYLSDTLLTYAFEDDEVLGRLLAGVRELKEVKLPLSEFFTKPDVIKQTVAATIHAMSFHNLRKADTIYNIAFGFSVFGDETLKSKLLILVPIRHDCVHRNGKSEDGKERTEVDFSFVNAVAFWFDATVRYIESKLTGNDYVSASDWPGLGTPELDRF